MKNIFFLIALISSGGLAAAEMDHGNGHAMDHAKDHTMDHEMHHGPNQNMDTAMKTVSTVSMEEIEIRDAYVRGLPPGVPNTSAYMIIHNAGNEDIQLIGGQADFAESVTLHASENDEGMMSMVHMMTMTIPAGGELVLASGGLHLMLSGLNRPLGNEEVVLTLEFQGGLVKTLRLPVISVLDE